MIHKNRIFRTTKFQPLAKYLLSKGITANKVTFVAFLSSIAAIFFLMQNYWLFALFAILQMLLDGLDGVLARTGKKTIEGPYYDIISDNFLAVGIILKTALHYSVLIGIIAATLFGISILIHILSKLKSPVFFVRVVVTIGAIIILFPAMVYTLLLLQISYIILLLIALYILGEQLRWKIKK
jgi:phosphatidylglycerophosphate synthase